MTQYGFTFEMEFQHAVKLVEKSMKLNWITNTDDIYEYLRGRGIDKKMIDICNGKERYF